jgi:hypothetical protein
LIVLRKSSGRCEGCHCKKDAQKVTVGMGGEVHEYESIYL